MNFLKKNYTLRRYSEPKYVQGYSSIPYEDLTLPMDIQTLEDTIKTEEDGRKSIQKLKVFCDYEILAEDEHKKRARDSRMYSIRTSLMKCSAAMCRICSFSAFM